MNSTTSAEPELLWHYTTTDGFLGILGHRTLWATDARYLNDTSELDSAFAALKEEVEDAGKRAPAGSSVRQLWLWMTGLQEGKLRLDDKLIAPYLTCFCDTGDLLSQWRGYADGGGFAIGYERTTLAGAAGELVKVEYLRPGADLQPLLSSLAAFGSADQEHVTGRIEPRVLAQYKHPAFEEEREWRIICAADSAPRPVFFRTGPVGLTPYVELKIGVHPSRVIVGPGANAGERYEAARRFLNELGASSTELEHSAAPFRG